MKKNLDVVAWVILLLMVLNAKEAPDGIDYSKQRLSAHSRKYSVLTDKSDPTHKAGKWFVIIVPPIAMIFARVRRKRDDE